ncbi:hypothetical protein J1614_009704 [Plenodomus biglobosus]|nr:hypothetical protein J1614_009704 [Plenodomus biglobosus]
MSSFINAISNISGSIFGSSPVSARRQPLKRRANSDPARAVKAEGYDSTSEEDMSPTYYSHDREGKGRQPETILSSDEEYVIGEESTKEEFTDDEDMYEEIGEWRIQGENIYANESPGPDLYSDEEYASDEHGELGPEEERLARATAVAPLSMGPLLGRSLLPPIAGALRPSITALSGTTFKQARCQAAEEHRAAAKATYDKIKEALRTMPPSAVAEKLKVQLMELKADLERTPGFDANPLKLVLEKARGKIPFTASSPKGSGIASARYEAVEIGSSDEETSNSEPMSDSSLGDSEEDTKIPQPPNFTTRPLPTNSTKTIKSLKTTQLPPHPVSRLRAPIIPASSSTTIPRTPKLTSSPFTTNSPTPLPLGLASKPQPNPPPRSPPTPSAADPWATNPNAHAHAILAAKGPIAARTSIARSLHEPEYTIRDIEVRDSLWQIMDQIEVLAGTFFASRVVSFPGGVVPAAWYAGMSVETARVVGCVGSGGPGGKTGWDELFVQEGKRRALVCAVVGNVLVEQVFRHGFFGGGEEHEEALRRLEERFREDDGFLRNTHYAEYIARVLDGSPTSESEFRLPHTFNNHVIHIIQALWTHLKPLYKFCSTHTDTAPIPPALFAKLHNIVTHAGLLSLLMQLDKHTVYHFEPLFKEDNYNPQRMECMNRAEMAQQNPHTALDKVNEAERERRAALSEAEKLRAKGDDALTQITIMNGLVAYRLGGWETKNSTALDPKYEVSAYEEQGVRVRVLTHGWVYCRWGRARGYSNGEVGAGGDERIHGDAWKGGFLEFTDVEGVPNWLEKDRREKGRKKVVSQGKGNEKDRGGR